MTLKLIDKDLRNKYAEALYKNELSYDKIVDKQLKRIQLDLMRSEQTIEAGSQIFLNKVRQKRNKWNTDDQRFRDHYKLVCRSVYNKKLENLNKCFSSSNVKQLDEVAKSRYEFVKRELRANNSDHHHNHVNSMSMSDDHRVSQVPRLPPINLLSHRSNDEDDDLYSRYSRSDVEFIDKFPAKIEITVTEVGKQFINTERDKHLTVRRQKQRFRRIQDHALDDQRFNNLVNYLEEPKQGSSFVIDESMLFESNGVS